MNSKDFNPGDILKATYQEINKGYHPIIFISGRSSRNFIGAMITHHADKKRNVEMEATHFKNGYEFKFDKSYVVKGRFIKSEEWGPFRKIGQLTEKGLEFVNNAIAQEQEETFAKYFARLTNDKNIQ